MAEMGKGSKSSRRPRWPYLPGQGVLLAAAIGTFAGAALPWAVVLGRFLWGAPLAVSWVLWAGLMTLAAALVPRRGIVIVSSFLGGGTAIAFGVWQTVRLLRLCLSPGCLPGPGLGLLLMAGGTAVVHAVRLARSSG